MRKTVLILYGIATLAAMPVQYREAGVAAMLHVASLDSRLRRFGLERISVVKSYDLPELPDAISPRAVRITDAEDTMHSLLSHSGVRTTYGKSARAARRTPEQTAATLHSYEVLN